MLRGTWEVSAFDFCWDFICYTQWDLQRHEMHCCVQTISLQQNLFLAEADQNAGGSFFTEDSLRQHRFMYHFIWRNIHFPRANCQQIWIFAQKPDFAGCACTVMDTLVSPLWCNMMWRRLPVKSIFLGFVTCAHGFSQHSTHRTQTWHRQKQTNKFSWRKQILRSLDCTSGHTNERKILIRKRQNLLGDSVGCLNLPIESRNSWLSAANNSAKSMNSRAAFLWNFADHPRNLVRLSFDALTNKHNYSRQMRTNSHIMIRNCLYNRNGI